MSVNVGDLNATLSLTDSYSAGLQAAAAATVDASAEIDASLAAIPDSAAAASAAVSAASVEGAESLGAIDEAAVAAGTSMTAMAGSATLAGSELGSVGAQGIAGFGALGEAAEAAGASVTGAGADAAEGLATISEAADQAAAATDTVADSADNLQDVGSAAEDAGAGLDQLAEASDTASGAVDETSGALNDAQSAFGGVDAELHEAENAFGGAAESSVGMAEAITAAGESVGEFTELLSSMAEMAVGIGLVEAGASALELGDDLDHMSIATGVSTDNLQKLAFAAAQFDIPLDQLAMTMDRLAKNIETGSPKVVAAFQDMGLSIEALKAMSPDQQLEAISTALQGIPNPTQAAADAMNALGRVPPQMLAFLKSNVVDLEQGVTTMSEAQVKDLSQAEEAWKRFSTNAKTDIAEVVDGLMDFEKATGLFEDVFKGVIGTFGSTDFTAAAQGWRDLGIDIDNVKADLTAVKGAADEATVALPPVAAAAAWQNLGKDMMPLPPLLTDYAGQLLVAKVNMSELSAAQLQNIQAAMQQNVAQKDVEKTFSLVPGEYELIKKAMESATQSQAKQTAAVKAWSDQYNHAAETVKATALDTWFQSVGGSAHATAGEIAFYTNNLVTLQEKGANLNATEEQWLVDQGLAGMLLIKQTTLVQNLFPLLQKTGDGLTYVGKAAIDAFDAPLVPVENFLNGLTKMDASMDKLGDDAISKLVPGATAAAAAFTKFNIALEKGETQSLGFATNWDKDFKEVEGDLSTLASSTTGTFSTIVGDINKGVKAVQQFGDGIGDLESGNILGGITAIGSSVIGLVSDLWNSVFGLNATQQSLQNLGVTVKNQLFGDPWFASQTEELKELQGQAPLTQATLTDLFNGVTAGGQQATEAMSTLASLLPEIDKNASQAEATSGQLLAQVKAGGATASAALTDINTQVSDFQSAAATTSGVWSPAFQSLIQQAQQTGQSIASINSALATQTSNLTAGLNQEFQVTSDAYTAMAADQKTLADTSSSTADIAKATADLATQQAIIAGTQVQNAADAQGQAAAVVASVDAQMKAGTSFVAAMTTAEPAIEGLQQQLTATGFSGGAAFNLLNQMATLATGTVSGPLLKAVEGATQGVVALGNMGALTQSNFSGLESSIGSTFSALEAQGATGQAAMAAIQPDLQAAWQLEQQYGVTADSVTQSLIDQGVQQGIVGEKQESSTQQMVDALNGVKTDLDEVVQNMEGLGSAAMTAAGKMNDAFSTVKNPNVTLTYSTTDTTPQPPATSGTETNAASNAPAGGGSSAPPGPPLSEATWQGPIGDAPLTAVLSPGPVWLKQGDIYGMPALTPGGGSPDNVSTIGSTASATASGTGSGGDVNIHFDVAVSGIDGPSLERSAATLATIVVQKIQSSGVLQTAFVNRSVKPVLRQQGLL